MTSATTDFFNELHERGHEPMLAKTSGTMRFDVSNGKRTERWLVSVDKGDIAVSHKNAAADCVVRGRRDVFDRIMSGEINAMAAILRGAISLEGDTLLAVLFQRLLPAPPKKGRA
jgi:putative sterol carrier protein